MDDLIKQHNEHLARQREAQTAVVATTQTKQEQADLKKLITQAVSVIASTVRTHEPSVTVKNPVTSVHTPDVVVIAKAVQHLETALKPEKVSHDDIVAAVRELIPVLQAIPEAIRVPEAKEAVSVTNLEGVTTRLEQIVSAIQALPSEAPTVNVPAPRVTVPEVDLSPLLTAIQGVAKKLDAYKPLPVPETDLTPLVDAQVRTTEAVQSIQFPAPGVTPTDPLIRFAPADVDDSDTVQYFGFVDMTGAWYIQRYDTSGSIKTLRYARGITDYATGWSNRAAQSYDYLFNIF